MTSELFVISPFRMTTLRRTCSFSSMSFFTSELIFTEPQDIALALPEAARRMFAS